MTGLSDSRVRVVELHVWGWLLSVFQLASLGVVLNEYLRVRNATEKEVILDRLRPKIVNF